MYCQKGGCGRYAQYATFNTGKEIIIIKYGVPGIDFNLGGMELSMLSREFNTAKGWEKQVCLIHNALLGG